MLVTTSEISAVTGSGSPNRTAERFAVVATDLGILWDAGDSSVLIAFGDTYGAGWGGNGAGPEHADWRCNWLARATNRDLSMGLSIDSAALDTDDHAAEFIPRERGEHTVIPTAGVYSGGRHFVHYMSVDRWGDPGVFRTGHAGLAVSEDGGSTWDRAKKARFKNDRKGSHPFQMAAFARDEEGSVLVFGTPNGRFGDVRLAKVSAADVDSPKRWTYWTGSKWSADTDDATVVATGPAGELSVGWHHGLGQWVMTHLDEHKAAIVLRTADHPSGPWTEGEPLVSGREYPALYGGHLHPWSLESGNDFYFTMSQWGPYNVSLMRAQLS